MNSYLFTYSNLAAPETVHGILSSTQAVSTWISPFPYAAIVLSNLTARELTAILSMHLPQVWFVVAELTSESCNGILPLEFWDYVTNPYGAWSKKLFARFRDTEAVPQLPSPAGVVGTASKK